jgi:hypothetical protein
LLEFSQIQLAVADHFVGIFPGNLLQQFSRFGKMRRAARHGFTAGRKTLLQLWKNAVPEKIPVIRHIEIAFVIDPLQRMRLGIFKQLCPRHAQQRPQNRLDLAAHLAHGRQPFHPCTTEQLQHQGFGLIVLMVGQHDCIGFVVQQHGVAFGTRGGFKTQPGIARHIDGYRFKRNFILCANTGTEISPGFCIRADAVVDMHRRQLKIKAFAGLNQHVAQHPRIHPPTQT